MPGVRIGDMPFDRIGHGRQRVAFAVGVERRCIRSADQLSNFFQPPRCAAAPLNSADAARSQQPAAASAGHQYA